MIIPLRKKPQSIQYPIRTHCGDVPWTIQHPTQVKLNLEDSLLDYYNIIIRIDSIENNIILRKGKLE